MIFAFLSRCIWTAAAGGTADFAVSAAAPGFYTPSGCSNPAVVNGAPYRYIAVDAAGNHEEGDSPSFNTSTSTLTRSAAGVRNGTNGPGALVSFTSAPTVIMGGPTAGDIVAQAVAASFIYDLPSDDNNSDIHYGTPSGSVNRMALAGDAKNWTFLGQAKLAASAVSCGPIAWSQDYEQLFFEYDIAGYTGGTPAGRVLMGAASISLTAATNGNGLMENTTNGSTSVSVPGCPLGIALTANLPRSGHGWVQGISGGFKKMDIIGGSGTLAVATSPVVFQAKSYFSDGGTNLLIKQMQLTVYDTLTATAASTNQFAAGTLLRVWGRNND